MKILTLFGRESDYPRNTQLISFLSSRFEVDNPQAWLPTRSVTLRSLQVVMRAIPCLASRKYGIVLVGFYGYLILLLLRKMIHCPVVFDAFVSTYDTLVNDRQVFRSGSLGARLAFWLDSTVCRLANLIVVDTQAQKDYFVTNFALDPAKVAVLFVGCSDDIFKPATLEQSRDNLVLHYGTATPQHGVDTILQAAGILANRPDIHFLLVGPMGELARAVEQNNLVADSRIQLKSSVPLKILPELIRSASVCLCGHFGKSEKAGRVIAAKTYQCIAMGKAVIVGDNPANHEILTPDVDACFCPQDDPTILAEQIIYLVDHPEIRAELGRNAVRTYQAKASNQILQRVFLDLLNKVSNSG